ncbi:putative nicotinate-nucleotide--dimethylbenzimidazole phosphoribosyltransferase [Anopheles sinensis]|uniref:Putative nicotinate-nucleotide--dimethylbenzimidazole phosphoribosyltransferase n=1 Tax=Anopheles sinensis TaxID=74873 RepID=A0A084VYT1_ANOSI|nr:putative nicotinate-nucleotide--dimethylbenzimidazole phosphoribosyltransferase [Anopheles sinensis]
MSVIAASPSTTGPIMGRCGGRLLAKGNSSKSSDTTSAAINEKFLPVPSSEAPSAQAVVVEMKSRHHGHHVYESPNRKGAKPTMNPLQTAGAFDPIRFPAVSFHCRGSLLYALWGSDSGTVSARQGPLAMVRVVALDAMRTSAVR